EPMLHLVMDDMLGNSDRVYVAMPRLPQIRAENGSMLRAVIPARRKNAVLYGQDRLPLASYRQAVAMLPGLADDVRFGTKNGKYDIPGRLDLSDGLLRFIGYYIGEGHAEDQYVTLSSGDPEIVTDFLATTSALGLSHFRRADSCAFQFSSSLWAKLRARWCGRTA